VVVRAKRPPARPFEPPVPGHSSGRIVPDPNSSRRTRSRVARESASTTGHVREKRAHVLHQGLLVADVAYHVVEPRDRGSLRRRNRKPRHREEREKADRLHGHRLPSHVRPRHEKERAIVIQHEIERHRRRGHLAAPMPVHEDRMPRHTQQPPPSVSSQHALHPAPTPRRPVPRRGVRDNQDAAQPPCSPRGRRELLRIDPPRSCQGEF
jgi:hypothetical protein